MNQFLRISGIIVVIAVITFSCNNPQKEKEIVENELPNIILLMGDDHGWDETGYNGHPFVKTPVLDEMASSGMRFDRFYSGHPSCSPTRGSFMTGRHPNRYGTFSPGWSIRPEEVTIAHIAKNAGYATAHFGKWHLGPVKKDSPTSPGRMGFDEYLSHDNFFELNPVMSRNGEEPQKIMGESSEIVIDATIQFVEKTKEKGKPFMAVVWFGSPHEPYSGLPDDLALYDNLPDSLSNTEVGLTSNETGVRVNRPLRDVLRERYAEITAMDRAIGKLRNYLGENGLKENTLLMYCGDNGTPPSAGRTGMTLRSQKGKMYEGGIRVPGVLEWPAKIPQPVSTNAISVTSDYLPTLVELFGQQLPPRPIDGVSLLPLMTKPKTQRSKSLAFWSFNTRNVFDDNAIPYIESELQVGTTPLAKKMGDIFTRNFRNLRYESIEEGHYNGERTLMKGNFKLVLDGQSPNEDGVELYNIQNDSGETTNIAKEHPEIVEDMKQELRTWQGSVLISLTGADYD